MLFMAPVLQVAKSFLQYAFCFQPTWSSLDFKSSLHPAGWDFILAPVIKVFNSQILSNILGIKGQLQQTQLLPQNRNKKYFHLKLTPGPGVFCFPFYFWLFPFYFLLFGFQSFSLSWKAASPARVQWCFDMSSSHYLFIAEQTVSPVPHKCFICCKD